MKRKDIMKIFGVKEASALLEIPGIELITEEQVGSKERQDHLKYHLCRDKDGQHYLAATEGGKYAQIGTNSLFCLDGEDISMPIAPETVCLWASNYVDPSNARVWDGLPKERDFFCLENVWQYECDTEEGEPWGVREWLMKARTGMYILYTTAESYPLCFKSTVYAIGKDQIYMNVHYVTPETACRWAKARGMDEETCREAFSVR